MVPKSIKLVLKFHNVFGAHAAKCLDEVRYEVSAQFIGKWVAKNLSQGRE